MQTKRWLGGLGLLLGGALATVGAVGLYRRRGLSGLGFRGDAEAPVVGVTRQGGMVLKHRRSANMSIESRLKSIQDLVWKSTQDPRMRKIALGITRNCPERDGTCEAEAIYQAVKKRVRYTGDVAPIAMGAGGPVEGIDLFQSAYRTWEFGGGDCDDAAILLATLLANNGITPTLRVTSPTRSDDFSHIYVVAGLPKTAPTKKVALDTTLPGNKRFGYEVPYGRKKDFPA